MRWLDYVCDEKDHHIIESPHYSSVTNGSNTLVDSPVVYTRYMQSLDQNPNSLTLQAGPHIHSQSSSTFWQHTVQIDPFDRPVDISKHGWKHKRPENRWTVTRSRQHCNPCTANTANRSHDGHENRFQC